MADITNREADQVYRKVNQLCCKLLELNKYTNALCKIKLSSDDDELTHEKYLKLSLDKRKQYCLLYISKEITKLKLNDFISEVRTDSLFTNENWQHIQAQLLKMINSIPPYMIADLPKHRHPVIRWIKEFIALLGTGIVGSVAVTAYNAYTADKGTFSWNKVGFYSNTASINKLNAVYDLALDQSGTDNLDAIVDEVNNSLLSNY